MCVLELMLQCTVELITVDDSFEFVLYRFEIGYVEVYVEENRIIGPGEQVQYLGRQVERWTSRSPRFVRRKLCNQFGQRANKHCHCRREYRLLKRLEQERRSTVRGGIVVGIVSRQHVQEGDISLVECRNGISRNRVRELSGLWVQGERHRRLEC